MNFNIITLGCKVNQYESQMMYESLVSAGFVPCDDYKFSDITVINTCTVTSTSDSKNRKTINRVRRENPDTIIILTGCMPQAFSDDTELFSKCDIVLGNVSRNRLVDEINKYIVDKKQIIDIRPHTNNEKFENMQVSDFLVRTRAFVKIEDGCNRFCSYCIIPYARGRVRSKALDALKDEITSLSNNGYKEIVLVGINLSAYGQDIGLELCDAVECACSVEGIERVRLSSLEPERMTIDVIKRLSKQPKFCPHFHLSLQSGCTETLKRMHRHYTAEEYQNIVNDIRSTFKNSSITTDIMVGFAGESEDEFKQSLEFADTIGFAKAHVFAYSRRKGTIADKMPNQISQSEKTHRSKIMIEHTDKQRRDFLNTQVGLTEPVLFETINKKGFWEGYTSNYTPVWIKSDENLSGCLLDVSITDAFEDYCVGELTK